MVVGFFSLLGGLTGILVETSIAAKLGLSRSSDTFYVAFTVPYIITNLISATGQFSLVPFFASLESERSEEETWRGFSYVVNMLILGLGMMALVGAAASTWIVRGIAPGLTRPQLELATQLSQWLFLIIVPAGVAEALRSFLLSRHRFALSTATGFIRNAVVILAILAGFRHYGSYSIVLGYLGGFLAQLLVLGTQILVSFRVQYSLTLTAHGEAFRNLRGAGSAQLGGALAWQGVVVVERIIASFLPAGTITALNYGFKILGTLAELLGGSVGTAALPALSFAVARRDHEEERHTFRHALEISLLLLSPTLVFCLLLDHSIIRFVFQRGNFTPEATDLLAEVFFYYCLSLLAFAFLRLLNFYLFARREPGVYLRLSLIHDGVALVFELFFVGILRAGAIGIPLGYLVGSLVACGMAVHRNLGNLDAAFDRVLRRFAMKDVAAALLSAACVWALRGWLRPPVTAFQQFVFLCVVCGAGSGVYLAALAALRALPVPQLAMLWPRNGDS